MKPGATWLLTLRYLFEPGSGRKLSIRRIRGGILGVALSLVPLVLVYQVADGMISGISARYIETGSYHLQVMPPATLGDVRVGPEAVAAVKALDGVTWAGVELQGLALAASRFDTLGVTVRAVPPELLAEAGFRSYMTAKSGSLDLGDPQTILVGEEAARTLRVAVGDKLRLVTSRSDGSGGMIPRQSSFTVGGIVSCGYQELDRLWVFINLDRGRRVLATDSSSEFLAVKVADPYAIPNPLFAGETTAEDGRGGITERVSLALGPRWQAYTWFELARGQYLSFLTSRNLLLVIMALIVVVASVNVFSAMIMLVIEKQQEIAILKSVGAGPSGIALTFILAGGVTGGIGTIIGLGAGVLVTLRVNEVIAGLEWLTNQGARLWWQLSGQSGSHPFEAVSLLNPAFYLERIPVDIRIPDLLVMGALTVFLSMAASWFPARRAARLRPLAIFRKA